MRVLQLGKYYPPDKGGIERVVATLCRGESAYVESSALVCSKSRATTLERVDGVTVRRVGSVATIGAVTLAPALPVWLARARPDVIVLHEPNPMALLAYFIARPRAPLVVWFHSEVVRPRWQYRLVYEPLLRFVLGRAACIVTSSPPLLEAAPLAPYRDKCRAIPLGIHVERCARREELKAEAAQRRRAASRPTLLFVGRLVGYKGVDVLLRALPGLDADLVIVGDGPRRASLEALASGLGVAGQVRFVGETTDEDLLARYHACDVFVLPSVTRQETFGMVQVEAMLCGKPVVSTELGTGVSWVNQHERTGLVVPPGDADALHAALARVLADGALRHRLGAQARDRALEHFTAEKMCQATVALYRDVTGIREEASWPLPAGVGTVELS